MSKNVAVFVDVANIFYAAKAAGVDIDYVTLLKSATAGRDFVRAYAYTGLDPENENQRNFHAFLARSGYKVVSKDIRKYGDGRVKANLDIELVVDMMRMAEHLDVAVVVSGDGDFAPAINAVQQRGVRVEVISFRGNTSSDLIDVADVFIDIAQVAKVEKGARSGRRVASDGDLSMTEVPDKESGVTPRRRRRRPDDDRSERSGRSRRGSRKPAEPVEAVERAEPVEAVDADAAALVALPGEKLSRAEADAPAPADASASAADETAGAPSRDGEDAGEGSGRRRRRRRGGRGRGRGRSEDAKPVEAAAPAASDPVDTEDRAGTDDAADFPDEVPTLPQHSGFGSVWDSQIGVPGGTDTATPSDLDDDDIEGEPEVPEYLLAEKRRGGRGGRGGRGRGGRQGGYRSAIDRERYGSGRGSGRRGGSRQPTGTASAHAMEPIEQTLDGDPWSEVPPDVQELLRAEIARRQGSSGAAAPEADAEADADAAAEKPKKTTRKRATKKAAPEADAEADADAAAEKPKKTTRKRATKKAAPEADAEADADAAAEKPKKTTRKRATKKAAPEADAEAEADAAAEKPKKTTRKRATKKAAPEADAEAETPEPAVEA